MKNLLVLAIALTAINAQATRARVSALANSPHLIDTQTVYNNPADVHWLGADWVTLETGTTTASSTTTGSNAEGMIVRSAGDVKYGLSLGHRSDNAALSSLRGGLSLVTIPATLKLDQQNPVELTYGAKSGDMGWAGTLVYSNFNDKVNDIKESSAGVRFGARTANWDAALRIGLTNTVESAAAGKFTGTTSIGLNGGYTCSNNVYWNGAITTTGFKLENTTGTETGKVTATEIKLGAMTSVKKDGAEFFYGASLVQTDAKQATGTEVKVTSTSLPLFIGVETEASSWLTLRGSVTQTLQLLNSDKTESGGTAVSETAPGANDTTVAAGAGLKFNKVNVDGTLTAATSQQLNSTSLLAQVGMTYSF